MYFISTQIYIAGNAKDVYMFDFFSVISFDTADVHVYLTSYGSGAGAGAGARMPLCRCLCFNGNTIKINYSRFLRMKFTQKWETVLPPSRHFTFKPIRAIWAGGKYFLLLFAPIFPEKFFQASLSFVSMTILIHFLAPFFLLSFH